MLRLAGAGPVVFAADTGCNPFRRFAHLARCASAILRDGEPFTRQVQ
jgi:hypothetical protein